MPKIPTLFVIAPDGSKLTRKSPRTYTHAIVAKPSREAWVAGGWSSPERIAELDAQGHFDRWIALTWCGRPDLAVKELAKAQKGNWKNAIMVEVQQ